LSAGIVISFPIVGASRGSYYRAMYNAAKSPTSAMMKQPERNVPRLNSASISSVIAQFSGGTQGQTPTTLRLRQ